MMRMYFLSFFDSVVAMAPIRFCIAQEAVQRGRFFKVDHQVCSFYMDHI